MTDTNDSGGVVNEIVQGVEGAANIAAAIDPEIAPIITAIESAISVAQTGFSAIKAFLAKQDSTRQIATMNAASQKMAADLAALNAKAFPQKS